MIRVACARYAIREGDPEHNLEHPLLFIGRAAAEGARLVIPPELVNSGYDPGSREFALQLAERIPGGATSKRGTRRQKNAVPSPHRQPGR